MVRISRVNGCLPVVGQGGMYRAVITGKVILEHFSDSKTSEAVF